MEKDDDKDPTKREGDKEDPKGASSDPTKGSSKEDPSAADKERDAARVKAAEEENAKLRKERDEALAREKALADEKAKREAEELERQGKFKELAEAEKKNAENAKLEAAKTVQEANNRVITSEIKIALMQAGATDADIHVMIDRSDIKFENGSIVGVDAAIAKFKESKPHFFGDSKKTDKKGTGAGGTPPKGKEGGGDTPPDVTKMSDEEYNAHKRKVLASVGASGGFGGRLRARSRG